MLLVGVFHQAICDQQSLRIFRDELTRFYSLAKAEQESTPQIEPLYQLVELGHWHQVLLQTHAFDRRIGFWKTYLRPPLTHLRIPADRNPGSSLEAISTKIKIDAESMRGLIAACERWKTDPRGVFLTAYATVLSRRYRQRNSSLRCRYRGDNPTQKIGLPAQPLWSE